MISAWLLLVSWIAATPGVTAAPAHIAATEPRRTTLFLDFAGGPLRKGEGLGAARCATGDFVYPMFLGSARAAEIALTEARRLLAPYGVRVVAEPPPPWLPYTHVRMGGEAGSLDLDPELNGVSCDVDCADEHPRDTVFMFTDKFVDRVVVDPTDESLIGRQLGRIAVHEAGHSWGLEHAGASESVMSRFPSGAALPTFVEGCQALDLDGDSECPAERSAYCPEGLQDADAELLALFGDGAADLVAPSLQVVWPPDGLQVEAGTTVDVEIEVSDDRGGVGWWLSVPELEWEFIPTDPLETTVSLVVPVGSFTLQVEALDHDRNLSSVLVQIEGLGPEHIDELAEPEPERSAQCACRHSAEPWWSPWLLLLAITSVVRRRRARNADRSSCVL